MSNIYERGFRLFTIAEPLNGVPKKASLSLNVLVLYILTILNGIYIAHSPYQMTVLNKR